ncbi:hypothetical protein ACUUL3_07945 [Thiovibrio sp. JS02]
MRTAFFYLAQRKIRPSHYSKIVERNIPTAPPTRAQATCDQVRMVGHQVPGPGLHATFAASLGHQVEVFPMVVIAEESLLAAISPPGDMVRQAN